MSALSPFEDPTSLPLPNTSSSHYDYPLYFNNLTETISTTLDSLSTLSSIFENETEASNFSSLGNDSTAGGDGGATKFPSTMLGFTAACAFMIAIIGASGNLLTIIALPMCSALRTTANAFVVNLAVVELLFCVVILPLSGAQYAYLMMYNESLLSDKACVFFTATRYTLTQVELQSILAIALMRAIAVSCMNLYRRVNTAKFVRFYITIIWLYSFAIRVPIIAGVWGHYRFNSVTMECDMGVDRASISARIILLYLEGVAPVLLIILLYIFLFIMIVRRCAMRMRRFKARREAVFDVRNKTFVVRKSSNRVQALSTRRPPLPSQSEATDSADEDPTSGGDEARGGNRKLSSASFKSLKRKVSETNFRQTFARRSSTLSQRLSTSKRDMRVARTIFIIFLLLMVCSIPVLMAHILDRNVVHKKRFLALHILYWVQYCVNFFIYVIMNRQYRDAYLNLLSKIIPSWKRHQGFRFPWEAPSHSAKPGQQEHNSSVRSPRGSIKESQPQRDSSEVMSCTQGYARSGRLSAIPEGGSTSVGDDALPHDVNGRPVLLTLPSDSSNEDSQDSIKRASRTQKDMKSFGQKAEDSVDDDKAEDGIRMDSCELEDPSEEVVNGVLKMKDLDAVSVCSSTPLKEGQVETQNNEEGEVSKRDSYVNINGVSQHSVPNATEL